MTKTVVGWIWALGLLFASVAPSGASAQVQGAQLATPGSSMIGMIQGQAAIATQPANGGSCTFVTLANGGLTSNVWIIGTEGGDGLVHPSSPTSWCGYTINPLITNGYSVTFFGQGGNDFAAAGPGGYIYGGTGNDAMYPGWYPGAKRFYGGDNNDTMNSLGDPLVYMYGQNGDDKLCGHPNVAIIAMDGGSGSDTFCGTVTWPATVVGVELYNCSVCGY